MHPPSPARRAVTIFKSLVIAGTFVFCGAKAILITGTKANATFSSVAIKPPAVRSVTTTTSTPSVGTTTSANPPAAGGR